jgi:hypothetical protein
MGKRISRAESTLIALALVVGLPIYAATKIFQTTGWVIPALVVVAIVLLIVWQKHAKKQKRLAYLRAKYHDEKVVQNIYAGYFWRGQTEEQLRDSIGPPAAIDNKLLKTMTREIWKYHASGVNRYRLRITVENGRVAGWDKKS